MSDDDDERRRRNQESRVQAHAEDPAAPPVGNYVGMPGALHLDLFGQQVRAAFGHPPYLVGSATRLKQWRDVDVRLILPDAEFAALGLRCDGVPCAKLDSLNMAYAALARHMTGLPIDFQIQQQTRANARYGDHPRLALIAACQLQFANG
jgi:hypothetical protein